MSKTRGVFMVIFFCLAFCISGLFGAADDDLKKEIPKEHLEEAQAAHNIANLVFDCVQKMRITKEEEIYYSDERNEAFEDYPDDPDAFRIDSGLVLAVQNNIPGKLFTRWGVWHFAQSRFVVGSYNPQALWAQCCNDIIQHKLITLNQIDVPASLQAEQLFVVQMVQDIKLEHPLQEKIEQQEEEELFLVAMLKQFDEHVIDPVKKWCSDLGDRLPTLPFVQKDRLKKNANNSIKPYRPSSYVRARSFPQALSDNERYWLRLSSICKKK